MLLAISLVASAPRTVRAASAQKQSEQKKDPDRREIGLVPAISFSTDIGLGLGALMSWAKFKPGYDPFRYRIQAQAFFTLKKGESGFSAPFHSDYVQLDLPDLFGRRVRLNFELAFRRFSNAGYYGLGNASSGENPYAGGDVRAEQHFRYVRTYPSLQARARVMLSDSRRWQLLAGAAVTDNAFSDCDGDAPCPETKLERDKRARAVDRELERALRGTDDHLLPTAIVGVVYDSRDHAFAPSRGMFHELSVRGSPRPELVFAGVNATLRFFHSLAGRRLVLAWRVVGDMLLGQVPFYELSRHGGLFPDDSLGGATAVRGVPIGRYHARIKIFANFEMRAQLLPFELFGLPMNLGAVAFVDVGRSFTDYRAITRLDGDGHGLKTGVGGGLRLLWGDAFVIRADFAWSPDAEPLGVYVDVGHIF